MGQGKSGRKSSNGFDSKLLAINKDLEKFGIPSNAIDEDEYLSIYGVSNASSGWVLDKLRGNRQIKTVRGKERFIKEYEKAESEYQAKRSARIEEYNNLISKGILRQKTTIERTLKIAQGNDELASVQSARRMATKRGYDWQTGKKLEQ